MPNTRASAEVMHDDHDEEQVDLDGDEEPEEIMDEEVEDEGDVEEEEKNDGQEGLDLDAAEDEGSGSQDEQDANVSNGGNEKASEDDDGNNDTVEDVAPTTEGGSQSIDKKELNKDDDPLTRPPHGSEVFVGNLPRDATEADLRALCEKCGEIYDVSIKADRNKLQNKAGFAFVTFTSKESATKAIETLNGSEFKDKKLRFSHSQTKNRVFLGNIPRSLKEEDLERVVSEQGPGVQSVELPKDPQDSTKNRGFAFVEYYNSASAEKSMKNMKDSKFKLDDRTITVKWETGQRNATETTNTAQVKSVYVRNLPDNVTEEQLRELFQRHGEVTKVVLLEPKPGQPKRDFGFVHFADHDSAMKAIEKTEKYELDGRELETSLAKPLPDKKPQSMLNPYSFQRPGLLSNYHPQAGYGYGANMYGSFGAGFGSTGGYAQPVIYGRGPTPEGMTMVPMMLPDGRVGYVLQQPSNGVGGSASHRGGSASYRGGGSASYRSDRTGSGGGRQSRGNNSGSGGTRRYRPY
eukprot:Gb_14828 [translate_table: standard]